MQLPRSGSTATVVVIAVVVLIILGVALFLWRPKVAAPQAIIGQVTAIRAADGKPTYLLTSLGAKAGITPGTKLHVIRDGKPVAELMVETVTSAAEGSACRVLSASVPSFVEGDMVRVP